MYEVVFFVFFFVPAIIVRLFDYYFKSYAIKHIDLGLRVMLQHQKKNKTERNGDLPSISPCTVLGLVRPGLSG